MQSVVEIQDNVARGIKDPHDIISTCFQSIAENDPDIEAFTHLPPVNEISASAQGPLAGIALGVKDIFDTFDMPTAYGSPIYHNHRPKSDAAIVAMARRTGATVVGKTVTTEFAFLQPAQTRNPINMNHTPGGSSSGSAAAVAAGMIPAALGTQTGGSVIRPAAYCGICGFKPSFRLLPTTGFKTFSWSLDTCGLFTSSVADMAALASGLSGRDLAITSPPQKIRVGLCKAANWNKASDEMQQAVLEATRIAADAGAEVIEIDEPDILHQAREIHSIIQNFEAAHACLSDYLQAANEMSSILRSTLEAGFSIPPDQYDQARATARNARKQATRLFETVDVLLTPSAPDHAPEGLSSTGEPIFNKLWTLTGNPAINVPGLISSNNLPLGIQLVARFGRDKQLLSIAHWLEQLLANNQ